MAPRVDLVGLIEAAYDTAPDATTWLARIAEHMAPLFARGGPVLPYLFTLDAASGRIEHHDLASPDPAFTAAKLGNMHRRYGGAGPMRRAYECPVLDKMSHVLGEDLSTEMLRGLPAEDMLGLRANDEALTGALFCTPVPRGFRIPQRDQVLWPRIAAHIGAGLRLRQRLARQQPDAWLTPAGTLAHGSERAVRARADLGDAARAIDRARGRLRRLNPGAATELWRAMVQGEWTLLDWFDHDGKRYLLAHDNRLGPPPPSRRAELSLREWQVVSCAAMGHSNKLIAYDLGLTSATISSYLRRAAYKLGATSRIGLVELARERLGGEGEP